MKTTTLHAALAFATAALITAGCASFEEIRIKADAGDSAAQYRVAKAYARGEETVQDLQKAEEYFEKAIAGGEKDAQRDLFLFWMENGKLDKVETIIAEYPKVAKSSILSWGLDSDLLNIAPKFAKKLVDSEQFDDYERFSKMILSTEMDLFNQRRAAGGGGPGFLDTNEMRTYSSLMDRVEMLKTMRIRKVQDAEEARLKREKLEEEAKLALEKQLAELKLRGEEGIVALEKQLDELEPDAEWMRPVLEKELAELKTREEAARLAREKAKREWLEKKDNLDYKFPIHERFGESAPVYKEFKTGFSFEWCVQNISHSSYANVQFKAGDAEKYLNPTNIVFMDESRKIELAFSSPADGDPQVLVHATIQFGKDDVSHEALVSKYRNELKDVESDESEITEVEGGGMLFGVPLPTIRTRFDVCTFKTSFSSICVKTPKGVSLDMGAHHVDETGKYSGPAGKTMADSLVRGQPANQLDMELAGKAVSIWKDINEQCGIPSVTITDTVLSGAAEEGFTLHVRAEKEKAKREAEEAANRKRALEAERANSF